MSKMRSTRKPPLARSPIRLRSRRVLGSDATSVQTPPGSLTKSELPNRVWDMDESELRPEYRTISCELRALAKMVRNEFRSSGDGGTAGTVDAISSPLFERGRFYEEYCARRNERLKRKKGEPGKSTYDLGVKVESAKRRESKKLEGLRRSIPSTPATERRENPRYLLRSSTGKENKKPPLVVNSDMSVGRGGDRRTGVRSVPKK